ncbi:MAG: ribulose-phosphate 3-epimerase [Candidatus Paceibacteria bacterium]|jgi:ribulose-phosphate 3-epimerase
MIPIVPAIIPTSREQLVESLKIIAFSPEVHVDVVDGHFTPTASWPCNPTGDPVSVKEAADTFTLEVDLMIENPLLSAVDWITAGADMLVFHVETIGLENFKNFAEFTHVTLSVACHGDTPIEKLLEYAQYADGVQLMGIKEIGAQGQSFNDDVLTNIAIVKRAYPDKPITVDGSVNADTLKLVVEAGADRVIVGSAIMLQTEPYRAYEELVELIK